MSTLQALAAHGDERAKALLAKLAEEFGHVKSDGGASNDVANKSLPRHERLYREAQAKKERMAKAAAAKREQEVRDSRTGEALFKPKINRSGPKKSTLEREIIREEKLRFQEQMHQHQDLYHDDEEIYYSDDESYMFSSGRNRSSGNSKKPVHERLAQKAEQYRQRAKERRERKEAQRQKKVRESAKTSAKSAHIVRKLEKRGDLTPTDQRLRQRIGAVRQRTIEEIQEKMPFRPRINPSPAGRKVHGEGQRTGREAPKKGMKQTKQTVAGIMRKPRRLTID